MSEPFAHRELMGWPGVSLDLNVKTGSFMVVARNSNTGQTKLLYRGKNFADASKAYKHPFVWYHEELSEVIELQEV